MEKSSTATLECEDIKTRLQNDDEDSIPLADDDVSASVLGTVFLLKKVVIGGRKRQNLSIWLQNAVGDSRPHSQLDTSLDFQIYMDALPWVPGVSKTQILFFYKLNF